MNNWQLIWASIDVKVTIHAFTFGDENHWLTIRLEMKENHLPWPIYSAINLDKSCRFPCNRQYCKNLGIQQNSWTSENLWTFQHPLAFGGCKFYLQLLVNVMIICLFRVRRKLKVSSSKIITMTHVWHKAIDTTLISQLF